MEKSTIKQKKIYFDVISVSFSDVNTDARTLNMINTLTKLGKSVCLICFSDFEKPFYFQENVLIFPVPLSIFDNHKLKSFQKLFKFNNFVNEKYLKNHINLINSKKEINLKDISSNFVIAHDLYALPVARKIAIGKKNKLIYDSREVYSQIGSLHSNRFKQKILTWFEKYLVLKVNTIITSGELDTEYLKEHLSSKFYKKIDYFEIYNYPPYLDFNSSNSNRFEIDIYERYNINPEHKIMVYQGKIMEGRGLKQSIELMQYFEEFHLCIFGDGELKEYFENLVYKLNVKDKVTFCGTVLYEKLLYYTRQCYAGLVLFEPISTSYKFALPNKLFEYAMAEIPVIATDLPAIRKILEENMFGLMIDKKMDILELKSMIDLIKTEENYHKLKEKSLKAKLIYNYDNQTEIINNIFSEKF